MKALVTGGAGFIGSNLVDRLVNSGYEVTVIDDESSDANEQFYWRSNTNNHKLNICDYQSTRKLYDDVDYVFHFAAEARIQPSILNPVKAATTNFVGTCTVLQCAREAGVKRVMYSSTSSAYGLKNEPPLKETMPNDCLNPYSVSKVGGEQLCKMYWDLFGLQTVIFRYFNVYGERQPIKGQYAPVIGIFLRQKAAGEPMTIVGDGEQRRDFTHVSDVVSANMLAAEFFPIEKNWQWGQIYNVGTGINNSVNEIANMIKGKTTNISARSGEARVTLADIEKIKNHFGWNPKVCLQDWIKANK